MANRWGKKRKQWHILFPWAPRSLQTLTAAMKLKNTRSLKEKLLTTLDSVLKSKDITLPTKVCIVKAMVFLAAHTNVRDGPEEEGWAPKNWWFQTTVLEKTLESPLDCKEIQPVHPKGNQPWIFIGRTDAETEAPILWPLVAKSRLFGKDPNAGQDGRQKENRAAEDEMNTKHHWFNGHECEETPGDSGQGSLACCSPWGRKELDMP